MGSMGGLEYSIDCSNQLGRGSFGVVCVGRIQSSGQEVAVKSSDSPKGIEAMRTEIELLLRLHEDGGAPNIVKIIGWKHTRSSGPGRSQQVSLAMEMGRCSLEEFMKEGPFLNGLPSDIMIDLINDCCSAWKSLLAKNMAHRDIKHQNILVFRASKKGRRSCHLFKLCDLGGSKWSDDDKNGMCTLVGTPNCLHPKMARELARGPNHKWKVDEPYSSAECDGWSFACTLYFAACGCYPFPHGRDHTVYSEVVNKLPKDAISAVQVHGKGGPRQYIYKKSVENPLYPAWFTHCLSALLRSLLHSPSFEAFEEMSRGLFEAVEFEFLSITRLQVVRYADISGCSHFQPDYPSLRSATVLDEPTTVPLSLISIDDVIQLPAHVDGGYGPMEDLSRLRPQVPYLVFPMMTAEFKLHPKPWKTTAAFEAHSPLTDAHTASLMRTASLGEAFRALDDCQMLARLQQTARHILNVQTTAALRSAESLIDSTSVTLRFANYSESTCQAWMNSEQDRAIAMAGVTQSQTMTRELERHLGTLSQIVDGLKEHAAHLNEMIDEDWEIPGVEDELMRYHLSALDQLKATTKYMQQLVQSCMDSRKRLADRLRTRLDPVAGQPAATPTGEVIIKATHNLLFAQSTIAQLRLHVDDANAIIERPFQEVKTRVNQQLNALNISKSDIKRTFSFYNDPRRVAKSSQQIHELAKELAAKTSMLSQ